MVAFTPFRNYPYAQATDPADVPERLQAFAEAVDFDLEFEEARAQPRHMAQFFGNIQNTVPGTATSGMLTWQLTDFNTVREVGPSDPAMVPVTDAATTVLRVNFPGFWYVTTTVQIGSSAAGIDLVGIEILQNSVVVGTNVSSLTHDVVFAADGTHVLDASCGLFMAANDSVSVRGRVGRSSGTASVRFLNRSITALRMTQS